MRAARFEGVETRGQARHEVGEVEHQSRHAGGVWMTAAECMGYLRFGSRSALQRAIRTRRLPYHRNGRHLRFYRPEVDTWLLGTGCAPATR